MEDVTRLNSALWGDEQERTVLNPSLLRPEQETPGQQEGRLLLGKYRVVEKLNLPAGEADLYLCRREETDYVAKVYRRQCAIKPELSRRLSEVDSPYVAKVLETGVEDGYPVEIVPYFSYGSMKGKRYSFEQLKYQIIPRLNEGLHALHQKGILHKDLKPSNIMIKNEMLEPAIIDFGISSAKPDERTIVLTETGMTPEYSAPETFRNVFLAESDYYSLGVTVYELFLGMEPYKNMSQEEIERYISVQKLPLPEQMPEDLKKLITGCTYYDITNRKDKQNPNRRWTYEEVKKWCMGVEQPVPGEAGGAFGGFYRFEQGKYGNKNARQEGSEIYPYSFLGTSYTKTEALVKAMVLSWEEGKKQLYRGILSGFYKSCNPEYAGYCMDAEELVQEDRGKEDAAFLQLMYQLTPGVSDFYWQNCVYPNLAALGEDILFRLREKDVSKIYTFARMLSEKAVSVYLQMRKLNPDSSWQRALKGLEKERFAEQNERRVRRQLYFAGYLLSGKQTFYIFRREFQTVEEFTEYMRSILWNSYEEYEEKCQQLLDDALRPDVQLESWLYIQGKQELMG